MAGSLCPEILLNCVRTEINTNQILISYGMTETSSTSFTTRMEDSVERKTQTVGRVFLHLEAKIVDEEGNTVPVGQQGKFLVKRFSVMKRYYGNQKATD